MVWRNNNPDSSRILLLQANQPFSWFLHPPHLINHIGLSAICVNKESIVGQDKDIGLVVPVENISHLSQKLCLIRLTVIILKKGVVGDGKYHALQGLLPHGHMMQLFMECLFVQTLSVQITVVGWIFKGYINKYDNQRQSKGSREKPRKHNVYGNGSSHDQNHKRANTPEKPHN